MSQIGTLTPAHFFALEIRIAHAVTYLTNHGWDRSRCNRLGMQLFIGPEDAQGKLLSIELPLLDNHPSKNTYLAGALNLCCALYEIEPEALICEIGYAYRPLHAHTQASV